MNENQAIENQNQPTSVEDRIADLLPRLCETLETIMPQLMEIGDHMSEVYPPESTSPQVIAAVTVPVPLRYYMSLLTAASLFLREKNPNGIMKNLGLDGGKE